MYMFPHIKKILTGLANIHWIIWLGLVVVATTVSLIALRQNNLQMGELREAVYAADKSGKGIEPALNNLQNYVTSHMNTSLTSPNGIYPPIQLTNTYKRLSKQATTDTYHAAQVYCEKNQPAGFYGAYRIDCVQAYIASHPTKEPKADLPEALYQFDFLSPVWSPDLAGWSLLVDAFAFAGLVSGFAYRRLGQAN